MQTKLVLQNCFKLTKKQKKQEENQHKTKAIVEKMLRKRGPQAKTVHNGVAVTAIQTVRRLDTSRERVETLTFKLSWCVVVSSRQ